MKPTFLLLLLFLPSVLAGDIDLLLTDTVYAPDETVATRIVIAPNTSLTQPLSTSHFKLLDSNGTKIPLTQSITQLWSKEYYHTLELPADIPSGSYTLGFYSLLYTANGKETQTNLIHNITIAARNTTLLFRPAFLYQTINPLEQPTFRITLVNTGTPATFTLNSTHPLFQPQPSSITLQSNEQTTFTIITRVANDPEEHYYANILISANEQTAALPVILHRAGTLNRYFFIEQDYTPPQQQNLTSPYGTITLTSLQAIHQTIAPDDQLSGRLTFSYAADQPLSTLHLVVSDTLRDVVSLETETLALTPGQEYSIPLLINPNKNITTTHEGDLRFTTSDGTELAIIPITILVKQTFLPPENKTIKLTNQTIIIPPAEEQSNALLYTVLGIILLIAIVIGYSLYKRGKQKPDKFEDLLSKAMQH